MSSIYLPVFDSYDEDTRDLIAVINAVINWKKYFEGILPYADYGMVAVLENNCQGPFTYYIQGAEVSYVGPVSVPYICRSTWFLPTRFAYLTFILFAHDPAHIATSGRPTRH